MVTGQNQGGSGGGNGWGADPGGPGPNGSWSEKNGQYNYNGDSGVPTDVSPYFPTLQQAQNYWMQNQQGAATAAGLPTAGQLQAMQPGSYGQFGSVPYLDPATYSASMIAGNNAQGYMSQYANELQQSLAPGFAQAQTDASGQQAARGIFNSGAGQYLSNQLTGEQNAAVAGQLGNLTQQAFGYTQQDVLANAEAQNQANQYNATATNSANAANASSYQNAVSGDQAQYNAFMQTLLSGGQGLSSTLLGSYLGSYGDTSAGNVLAAGLPGEQNAYSNAYGAAGNNSWGSQLGNAFGNLFAPGSGGGYNPSNPSGEGQQGLQDAYNYGNGNMNAM